MPSTPMSTVSFLSLDSSATAPSPPVLCYRSSTRTPICSYPPFDKSSLKVIEKAIFSLNLSLTPNNDGEAIWLGIPQFTSERRREFSKLIAKQAEEGKVAIRNIRRDAIKAYEELEKKHECYIRTALESSPVDAVDPTLMNPSVRLENL